jgi:hypothetical protein
VGVVALVLLTKLRPGREDVVEFGPDATAATAADETAPGDDAGTVSAEASSEGAVDDPGPTRAGED